MMEMYTKAYEKYEEKCRAFGIDGIEFADFMKSLTVEQIVMMVSDLD